MRKGICAVMIAAVIIFSLIIPASAAETGSILVKNWGGAVALYRVGCLNGQEFWLNEEYGGGSVTLEEILSPNLALWLDSQSKAGVIKVPDLWGEVLFSELKPGLYLIAQRSAPAGQVPFEPFLVSVPWDGSQWHLRIDMEDTIQPQTDDSAQPVPMLLLMLLSGIGLIATIRQRRVWYGDPSEKMDG